jgi:hypothetical protein
LGFVFLMCGVTFLCTGVATRMVAFWAMAPAFIALGIVFLVIHRKRG